jgi:hypothetical protein
MMADWALQDPFHPPQHIVDISQPIGNLNGIERIDFGDTAMQLAYGQLYGSHYRDDEEESIIAPPIVHLHARLQREVFTEPPAGATAWMRTVQELHLHMTGIQMFAGSYLYSPTGDNRRWVYPGEIVIVAAAPEGTQVAPPGEGGASTYVRHDLCAYIFLPEHVWYPIDETTMVQRPGWHDAMAALLRPWVMLSKCGRIVRACNEALAVLNDTIADAAINATSPTWEEAHEGWEQFMRIRNIFADSAIVDTSGPTLNDRILLNFASWQNAAMSLFETDLQRIREVVRAHLGIQPNTTESRQGPTAPSQKAQRIENRQRRYIRIDRSRE